MAEDEHSGLPTIVGIGASAGGISALQHLFEELPQQVDAAFVVVVHLDPGHQSELPAIIAGRTGMGVTQVDRPEQVRPNHVYVIPPNRQLRITGDSISAIEFEEPRGLRAPIDMFFRSLARCGDELAVILTGAGADGSIGIKAVKESGGIILVQDPEEAEFPSMPSSAIATGAVDLVLPIAELARQLVELIRLRHEPDESALEDIEEQHLRRILAHVRVRTGHDFSQYKRATVVRRVARRMRVTRQATLAQYYNFIKGSGEEAQLLLGDLLISVTSFFREPEGFDTLAKLVIPQLAQGKVPGASIRIWVPGCASGEEAYSIAMLVLEQFSGQDIPASIQIFASDLDVSALAAGRAGLYPAAIEADVNDQRLKRFFTREGDGYRVRQELRDLVLFSVHNMLRDPPFAHIDLISCRNVQIYFDRELQQQALGIFHYALNPNGFLFLGPAETADMANGSFVMVDRKARIYRSASTRSDHRRALPRLLGSYNVPEPMGTVLPIEQPPPQRRREGLLHLQALERAAPPSILVNEHGKAMHLSESAGRFLHPPAGILSGDIIELVRPELRFDLQTALHHAFTRGEGSLSRQIAVRFNGDAHRVHMMVRPLANQVDSAPQQALVIFIEGEAIEDATEPVAATQRDNDESMRRLTEEVQSLRKQLRSTREQAETTNEDLRAANEELQSINEEYRSSSEELETSKEELQSINEELQTVNYELKLKFETISRAHNDLQNLITAMDSATLFLDADLRIKRFTPHVSALFNVKATDEGRPITDLTHLLEDNTWLHDARMVIANLVPVAREVRSRSGQWFDMRLRPYRTVDDRIEGVVINFMNVTERRRERDVLAESKRVKEMLVSELEHRTRNLLSVVQAVSARTLDDTRSLEEYRTLFADRLSGLLPVHDIAWRSSLSSVALDVLIDMELRAIGADPADSRITLDGPPVMLPVTAAQMLALALHELAACALDHGALAAPGAALSMRWQLTEAQSPRRLVFEWDETAAPMPANAAARRKLGRELIEQTLAPQLHAEVSYELRADGLRCRIHMPLE